MEHSTASKMQTRSLFKMGNLLRRLKPRRLSGLVEAPTRFFVLLFLTLLLLVIFSGVYQRSNKAYIDNPNEQVIPASSFIKAFPENKNTEPLSIKGELT